MANVLYCSKEKLDFELGDKSTQLFDGMSVSEVEDIIEEQSRVIDNYLSEVLTVPFVDIAAADKDTLPYVVRELCLSLCKYKFWSRKSVKDIPETIKKEYEGVIKLIERIQGGKIKIGTAEDHSDEEDDIEALGRTGAIKDKIRWSSKSKKFREEM